MAEPFIAQVQIFPYNFAPRGWAFCNGQDLPISQNTALFSLIGTTYGGDGRTTMRLPNLQGRAVMCPGRGPGLSDYRLGQSGGTETVTLTENQMPAHTHNLMAYSRPGDLKDPTNRSLARASGGSVTQTNSSANLVQMNSQALMPATGGSQAHNNMEPYLTLNFCIALVGQYPPRS